jgi:hypothetical protein
MSCLVAGAQNGTWTEIVHQRSEIAVVKDARGRIVSLANDVPNISPLVSARQVRKHSPGIGMIGMIVRKFNNLSASHAFIKEMQNSVLFGKMYRLNSLARVMCHVINRIGEKPRFRPVFRIF